MVVRVMVTGMFAGDEPLHPELADRLFLGYDDSHLLSHPLVVDAFYVEAMNPHYNRLYEQKKLAAETARTAEDWHRYVFLHEKPYRRQALWGIRDRVKSHRQWWELVREVWMTVEFPSSELDQWIRLFTLRKRGRHHMSDAPISELPELVTVYRGTGHRDWPGLSWTRDRDQAVWFARRFAPANPTLQTASVTHSQIIARIEGRGEQEIVCLPWAPSAIQTQQLAS